MVGVVTTPEGLRLLGRPKLPGADIIEVRVDYLLQAGVSIGRIHAALRERAHATLATLRIPDEGGMYPWALGERTACFLLLLEACDAFDIELATVRTLKSVTEAARQAQVKWIASAHSLVKPLGPQALASLERKFLNAPAGLWCAKIAARVDSMVDLHRLAHLLIRHPNVPWALMGTGTHAARTRSTLCHLGSRLAYGYLDEPSAPGQPSARDLARMVGT